jgi:hypothetical protein
MGVALQELLTDCVMQVPKVPHLTGNLRGSGAAFVSGRLIHQTSTGGIGTPPDSDSNKDTQDAIVGVAGYNTVYALHLHENPQFRFREDGTGGKYLSSKMRANEQEYFASINEEVAKVLR